MNVNDFIRTNIKKHLESLGLDAKLSYSCACDGLRFYSRAIANTSNPFKAACDHAGEQAKNYDLKFKYKSPSSASARTSKKPQEAFDFGGVK